jgi:hypothetical protein
MPNVTLGWRFQPGFDAGSSSRSYSATKICDVPASTKSGTVYDDVLPGGPEFARFKFVVDRVDQTGGGPVVVSEVVFMGTNPDDQDDLPVRLALEAAGWQVDQPDKYNEPEED